MNKLMKKVTTLIATVSMIASMGTTVFAAESYESNVGLLSNEATAFLLEHGVDTSVFTANALNTFDTLDAKTSIANSYDESVLALKDAAAANNFTNEQIQKYVEGLVSTPTTIVESEDNKIETYADNRPTDDGIGYEVKSKAGYYQSTAYATLPTVNRASSSASPSSAYMFFTVSDLAESWGIDVGIWYAYGSGIEAWRGCYNPADKVLQSGDVISGLTAGDRIYMSAVVETNGYLRFRILDASNFNNVYYDISYYVGDHGIYRSNACINRQISLCNNAANFNTGAYLRNAQFSDAYIYSSSGYSKTLASNTISNRLGAFGTNATNAKKVTVNSYSPWYAENISINF